MKTCHRLNFINIVIVNFLIVLQVPLFVIGHARLVDPPSRGSAWRFGFDTPINYNDNEVNCGGFTHQWQDNGGRCGVCGDSWSTKPRPHEPGGKYATSTVVRNYTVGQTITVTVEITANHRGFMEFRICPVDNNKEEKIRDCLNKNLMTLSDKNESRHRVALREGFHHIALDLPKDTFCKRCVLQWRYVAGNNWGICPDGTGALGCGPQEEFRACADISILPKNTSFSKRPNYSLKTTPEYVSTRKMRLAPPIPTTSRSTPITTNITTSKMTSTTRTTSKTTPSTTRITSKTTPSTTRVTSKMVPITIRTTSKTTPNTRTASKTTHIATGTTFKTTPISSTFRTTRITSTARRILITSPIKRTLTPSDSTRTSGTSPAIATIIPNIKLPTHTETAKKVCKAAGMWRIVPGINQWCSSNCNHIPPHCPNSHCICI